METANLDVAIPCRKLACRDRLHGPRPARSRHLRWRHGHIVPGRRPDGRRFRWTRPRRLQRVTECHPPRCRCGPPSFLLGRRRGRRRDQYLRRVRHSPPRIRYRAPGVRTGRGRSIDRAKPSPTSTSRRTEGRGSLPGRFGPGTKFPTLGQISYKDMRDAYEIEAAGLIDGGSDLLIIETQFDLLSVKAGINGSRRAMRHAGRGCSPAGPGDDRTDGQDVARDGDRCRAHDHRCAAPRRRRAELCDRARGDVRGPSPLVRNTPAYLSLASRTPACHR